ncbi:hypothetical protein KCP69_25825 [Salmonella enterica subsp. enterica]|nr:hypothetical protein KCP69_25825 [Salmonella enterica subsp. enterica]
MLLKAYSASLTVLAQTGSSLDSNRRMFKRRLLQVFIVRKKIKSRFAPHVTYPPHGRHLSRSVLGKLRRHLLNAMIKPTAGRGSGRLLFYAA